MKKNLVAPYGGLDAKGLLNEFQSTVEPAIQG